MSSQKNDGMFANLKNDIPAGLVVFLVAMPLCLGIALASGAPLFSGIIAGFVGGIVVTSFSGSPLGVSGPAAGLAVIVMGAIKDLGSFDIFLMAVVWAGLFQIILGFLRAGIIGYYFPSAVITGMLAGIGIKIFSKQVPHAVGYDKVPEGDLGYSQTDGQTVFSEFFNMFDYLSPSAITISVISLAVLILWETPFAKKNAIFRLIPAPLLVVILGVVLNLSFTGDWILGEDHMVKIPVAESISGFFGQFARPDFSQVFNLSVLRTAGVIALVASLETLLCVEATDKMDPQKRITPTNRELKAQGIGNMISGLIGGLPVTQVIVRSSTNIQSGGKSRMSALFHGILILISVMAIPNLINLIPKASLAAILLVVGYKLAKPSLFKKVYKTGITQFIPFVATIVGIYFTNLLAGIGIGLAIAIIEILYTSFRTPYHVEKDDNAQGTSLTIFLAEEVSFLNKGNILNTLNKVPDGATLKIDKSKARFIHPDVLEILSDFEENAKTRNIEIITINQSDEKPDNPVKTFNALVDNK